MAAFVEPDQNGRSADAKRTLQQAAELLGCHVETLRRRIRSGSLRAVRGPHGAYLVREADLAGTWVQPLAGRERRRLDEDESWHAVAKLIYQYRRTREQALDLLEEIRREPARRPRLVRLIEVQRLRLSGLSYREIASRLSLSERQARRLAHRDLEVALRIELVRDARRRPDDAGRRARDVVADLEDRIRRNGYGGKTRAEVASAWPKRIGYLYRWLTDEEVWRLQSLGLTAEQLEAIRLVGIPPDALGHLLSFGVGESEPPGHESHPGDGAS